MSSFTEILACDGTALYELDSRGISFRSSGRLQLFLAYDGMILLKLDDFQYEVNSSDQIVYEEADPQFRIVLYLKKYPAGKWIIKINQHMDEVFSCLNEKCYLKIKSQKAAQYSSSDYAEKGKQKVKKKVKENEKEEKKYKNLEDEEDEMETSQKRSSMTAGDAIVTASKGLGWGLSMTGQLLSKGFEAVGGVASKAVTPATQKVEISQNTKANLQLAKKTSKSILGFTATQVGNLFVFGKETISNVGQRFQKSDKGRQLQESPKYETVKNVSSTGLKVFSNIYSGIVNGVYEIGSGISKGTGKVIQKKYGEDAGEAANQMFQGAGNIVKIMRVPEDQAAKTFQD